MVTTDYKMVFGGNGKYCSCSIFPIFLMCRILHSLWFDWNI